MTLRVALYAPLFLGPTTGSVHRGPVPGLPRACRRARAGQLSAATAMLPLPGPA